MATILDYIDWRGDIPLEVSPFNEVDNLILAELSFLDFTGIVPAFFRAQEGISLRDAAKAYDSNPDKPTDMGLVVPKQIPDLMRKMAQSERFGTMKLNGYVSVMDRSKEEQFAALAIECGDGSVYLSFRGTDDSIIGWKEDMNLSFMETIPAQQDALRFVQTALEYYTEEKIRIGGHSKGGNLTVYCAVHMSEEQQKRLLAAYNNDGPGFSKKIVGTPEHQRVADRIFTYVPQNSIVGMLLQHEEKYQVVRSDQSGIQQHDGFSWQVCGTRFIHMDELTEFGKLQRSAIGDWIDGMSQEERIRFSEAVFDILSSNNAQNLTELDDDKWKTLTGFVSTYTQLDKDSKDFLIHTVKQLIASSIDNFKEDYAEPKIRKAVKKLEGKIRKDNPDKKQPAKRKRSRGKSKKESKE